MINRTKPSQRPRKLTDAKWDELKADLLETERAHDIKSSCYRDSTIDALLELYHNKCAMCETKRGTELQVDHFRPFKPRNTRTKPAHNQPGYYWLAYTWSNLIPLCSKCNVAKSNRFPIQRTGTRIDSHENTTPPFTPFNPYDIGWLQGIEQPLLLNPEVDQNILRHFSFSKDGTIRGKTDRGTETINICKLNRKNLKRERVEIRAGYVTSIQSAVKDYGENRNLDVFRGELIGVFKIMKKNIHKDEAHSLYHLYMYRYFDYFIGSYLQENIRRNIVNHFTAFASR